MRTQTIKTRVMVEYLLHTGKELKERQFNSEEKAEEFKSTLIGCADYVNSYLEPDESEVYNETFIS